MKYFFLFTISMLLSACQFFETEKISSDTFYEEEIKTITWNDVDTYPLFENCTSSTDKETVKQCFYATLHAEILSTLQQHRFVVHRAINEKVLVQITVSEKGILTIENIEIDSLTTLKFPKLASWITKSIDSLEAPLPALKRGIPVKTKFTLPVVLKTE